MIAYRFVPAATTCSLQNLDGDALGAGIESFGGAQNMTVPGFARPAFGASKLLVPQTYVRSLIKRQIDEPVVEPVPVPSRAITPLDVACSMKSCAWTVWSISNLHVSFERGTFSGILLHLERVVARVRTQIRICLSCILYSVDPDAEKSYLIEKHFAIAVE